MLKAVAHINGNTYKLKDYESVLHLLPSLYHSIPVTKNEMLEGSSINGDNLQ